MSSKKVFLFVSIGLGDGGAFISSLSNIIDSMSCSILMISGSGREDDPGDGDGDLVTDSNCISESI